MGKFSSDKDFAKRVSMHRDPEQHKKRDDNKKRGDNPNARRNKYKEQNNALNSRKDEHEKWGYELLNRKEQIFNQNKTTEEKAKTAAAEENKAAANAASVLSDKEIGEELNRLTAAFRATNGEKEEGELRAFAALHHLNLRVGTAVSKTDKSVIARMVFNGGVEKPMGNYSPKFADIANYPYKYAGTPGKAEDYDLESSTVWQAMKEEPRLAEMQDKLKAALAKAGVPKEILPEMNINDFKYLMFNHCAAQKGLGFAKLFQARDENGNPLTYKDRSGKEVPVCTSAKQENVKRFIKENPQFKDMMLKMPGIDKAYVEALVNKMSQSGLTDMSKELERHPEWANQPAIDVHHIINIKDCRLFEAEGKSYALSTPTTARKKAPRKVWPRQFLTSCTFNRYGSKKMMEYLKRKLSKMNNEQAWKEKVGYPRYYKENGLFIKETEDGEKLIVTLNEKHEEVITGKLK